MMLYRYLTQAAFLFSALNLTAVAAEIKRHRKDPVVDERRSNNSVDTTQHYQDSRRTSSVDQNSNNIATAVNCSVGGKPLVFSLTLDQYPTDISWSLYRIAPFITIADQGGYTGQFQAHTYGWCLPVGYCYHFDVHDSWGDGLSSGGYSLTYDGVEVMSYDPVESLQGSAVQFGDDCPPIDPPTASPTTATTDFSMSMSMSMSMSYSFPRFPTCDEDGINRQGMRSVPACPNGDLDVEFSITLDEWPEETSWGLYDSNHDKTFEEIIGYPKDNCKTYMYTWCLPSDSCYMLAVSDSHNDGLFGDGGYTLVVNDVEVMTYGDHYGDSNGEYATFGNACNIFLE
jgi:hypothetical protein